MISTKSPKSVAKVALAVGRGVFRDYAHKFSPKKFTRPQLFACLVLKEFEKKDYRGITALLEDCPDLCAAIELPSVPHFTTLQKASRRLLKTDRVRALIEQTVGRLMGKSKTVDYAAADSSGFEAYHASRYFVWRTDPKKGGKKDAPSQAKAAAKNKGKTDAAEEEKRAKESKAAKKRRGYKRYGKLMLVVNCATHAILAAVTSVGPTPDVDQLEGVVTELPPLIAIRHMLGDAGFDSAYNHWLLREYHGMLSTIPAKAGRPPKDPKTLPADKYRRQMKTRFNSKAYRRRTQVETVFSMLKRNLGSALRGRSHWSRCRDMMLRVLTHNIMLIQ